MLTESKEKEYNDSMKECPWCGKPPDSKGHHLQEMSKKGTLYNSLLV